MPKFIPPASAGGGGGGITGDWTQTAKTSITTSGVSSVTFQSVFTAGQRYRIRGYNLKVDTGTTSFIHARLMDGSTELSTTSRYHSGSFISDQEVATPANYGSYDSLHGAYDQWYLSGFTNIVAYALNHDTNDYMGVTFELELFIGPTPTTDDIVGRLGGTVYGGFLDNGAASIAAGRREYISYTPRTTPPDGIKFFTSSGDFQDGEGSFIAYDTLDAEFV